MTFTAQCSHDVQDTGHRTQTTPGGALARLPGVALSGRGEYVEKGRDCFTIFAQENAMARMGDQGLELGPAFIFCMHHVRVDEPGYTSSLSLPKGCVLLSLWHRVKQAKQEP